MLYNNFAKIKNQRGDIISPVVIEIIGICSTLLILTSMLFKTTTIKGSMIMRVLNLIGSFAFVVYGALLPALSTAILNAGLVIVNGYHLTLLLKENKKIKAEEGAVKNN